MKDQIATDAARSAFVRACLATEAAVQAWRKAFESGTQAEKDQTHKAYIATANEETKAYHVYIHFDTGNTCAPPRWGR